MIGAIWRDIAISLLILKTLMIELAFLLVGGRAFREDWWAPAALGTVLVFLAFALMAEVSAGLVMVATEAFGFVFVAQGIASLLLLLIEERGIKRYADAAKALSLTVLGLLIMRSSFVDDQVLAWLFGLGFAIDGLSRLATVAVVRFRRWGGAILASALELCLAAMILTDWPLQDAQNISLCIGLLLAMSGAKMIHVAYSLGRLHEATAIYSLPLFCDRGWNEETAVFMPDGSPDDDSITHLRVLVWTPAGAVDVQPRRPVIDRYLGALDADGKLSTGHAALEAVGDLYISHWPANEIDPNDYDFAEILHAGAQNDVPGLFQPSYAQECKEWTSADAEVVFLNFHIKRLRAYWEGYRRHATYNVTNRNCSIAVARGLEAALEGSLDCRSPWLRLVILLLDPRLWAAAYIRSRAAHLCWTPGMVLDYASALKRIIEPEPSAWSARLIRRLTGETLAVIPGLALPGGEASQRLDDGAAT
jgi:uncharacterized membrane protein HdeD (DUF308 family)